MYVKLSDNEAVALSPWQPMRACKLSFSCTPASQSLRCCSAKFRSYSELCFGCIHAWNRCRSDCQVRLSARVDQSRLWFNVLAILSYVGIQASVAGVSQVAVRERLYCLVILKSLMNLFEVLDIFHHNFGNHRVELGTCGFLDFHFCYIKSQR